MQKTIHIEQGVVRMPQWRLAHPLTLTLYDGEHLAIVGDNGSGKTLLTDILTGKHPLLLHSPEYDFRPSRHTMVSDNIKTLTFRDCYGGDTDRAYYLQQRWNQHDIDESTPTAGTLLEESFLSTGDDTTERRAWQQQLYELFRLSSLLDKYIITLSSGELRKFQLTRCLFAHPRILILDNPFIGLDATTREQLKELLSVVAHEMGTQLIVVVSRPEDIPPIITHVVEVKERSVGEKRPLEKYLQECVAPPSHILSAEQEQALLSLPNSHNVDYDTVLDMHDVSIRYGDRAILRHLDWCVHQGERWALTGSNGSGKSTLLSLVCADNPQSYACDITLFGHRRGSGESIWDIKRHIGYVSPEMHRSMMKNVGTLQIVATGMRNGVGLYGRATSEESAQCLWWMRLFGIEHLAARPFLTLSSGEQRLALVCRAFVKDPDLLILDEPLHGLDPRNRRLVKDIIEVFCRRRHKTLIMVTHYEEELPPLMTHHLHL